MKINSYRDLRDRGMICHYWQDEVIAARCIGRSIIGVKYALEHPLRADQINCLKIPLEDKAWMLFLMLDAQELELVAKQVVAPATPVAFNMQSLTRDLRGSANVYPQMTRVFSGVMEELRERLRPILCPAAIPYVQTLVYERFVDAVVYYEVKQSMKQALQCKADFTALVQPFAPGSQYSWCFDTEWRCNDCFRTEFGDFLVHSSTTSFAGSLATLCEHCVIKFFENKGVKYD